MTPSSVDLKMKGQPELRATMVRLALDMGVKGDDLHAELLKAGVKVSRSATFTWRRRLRADRSLNPHLRPAFVALVDRLLVLDDRQLDELSSRLDYFISGAEDTEENSPTAP